LRLVTVKFKNMKITLRNKKPLIDIDSFNKKADVIFKDVVIPQIKKYKTMKSKDLEKYRWWDILKELPQGWEIDKMNGSPCPNTVFITNGKSVISGKQKRALLKL